MGETTFLIKAKTKEGFEINFAGVFPDDFDMLYGRLNDPDFGYTPASAPQATVNFAGAVSHSGATGPLACQFCGNDVDPVKFGKIDQTAQEVATGRATKMGKMGKTAAPVCAKCWKQAGHAAAWDAFYKQSQG